MPVGGQPSCAGVGEREGGEVLLLLVVANLLAANDMDVEVVHALAALPHT